MAIKWEFIIPVVLILISLIIYLMGVMRSYKFEYHLIKNIILLASIMIFWFPYTVLPAWTVTTFNFYVTLLIFILILYLLFELNKGLHGSTKNIVPILIAFTLIGFSAYWFIKIPPYKVYTSGHEFEDIPLQKTSIFVFNFVAYGTVIIFFIAKHLRGANDT